MVSPLRRTDQARRLTFDELFRERRLIKVVLEQHLYSNVLSSYSACLHIPLL